MDRPSSSPRAPARCSRCRNSRATSGGFIEAIRLDDDQWLIINEEGKLHGLPLNPFATFAYKTLRHAGDDYIVGPALICTTLEAGGSE